MLFNKCIALFLIFLICSISVAVSEETDDKTFIFPKYPEQPTHSDFAAASNECPPLCPIGYLDEGVSCIGPDCTRICSIMACSDSGSIVFNDYSNRMPEWNDRTYDYEDEGPGFTLQSGKCYRLDYISSKSTDSSDSSECYDLYTDDDYKSEDYDMDCKGEDIDAYAGIGFVGSKKSGTWLRTIPGSTQNTDYGYIGKVDNSYWKYRYITYYGRDASPDNSGSDAGSWDSFNNEICDEAGTQTVYCAPSYESCALWGKNKCGYNCAGETTRPFIVMGVYGGDNNDLGDALDDNWNCGDIDDNNFFAQSNNYQVTEYNLEKKYSNTQAQCCISHHTSNCFDDNTYWYDSCGKLEDKKEDCQKFCTPWGSNYCKENGVYHQRTCYDTGCSAGSCYANPYTDEDKLASCTQGCSGGSCISCTPNNHYSCYDNDVYWYDSCGNLGAEKEECGVSSCGLWGPDYCKNNDVYHARTCINNGCGAGLCYSTADNHEELKEDCLNECHNGKCTECTGGPCCDAASHRFRTTNYKCKYYQELVGCTDSDNDVYHRYSDQYCSGLTSACDGQIVPVSNWYIHEQCNRDEICDNGKCVENCDETCKEWIEKDSIWKQRNCDDLNDDCSVDNVIVVKHYPDGFKRSKSDACYNDNDCCNSAGKCVSYDNTHVCVFSQNIDYAKCIKPPNKKHCDMPDGTAGCSCDSSFDCPYSHPYCENDYGLPVSDGYDACLASPPEYYCGDNDCSNGEDAASCPEDCSAGVGGLFITVQKDGIPIEDVLIELDNKYSGKTDRYGKLKLIVKYGTYKITACCGGNCQTTSKTIDGDAYETFKDLSCSPLDSDGDGWTDREEEGIGTDPKDKSSNFNAYINEHEPDKDWLNPDPLFNGVLSAAEKKIMAERFMALSSQELQSPKLAEELLFNITANKTGPKLLTALENGQEISISQNNGYALLLLTDAQGRTSAFILIPAAAGFLIGLVSGAYGGLKDDVVTLPIVLIKALWYIVINLNKIFYVWGYVRDAIKGISSMISQIDNSIVAHIVSQGEGFLARFSIKCDDNTRVSFLYGFYYGYAIGYVAEQILAFGYITKALKSFAAGEKFVAVTAKATQTLTRITNKFGSSVAYSLKSLDIWGKAVHWGDDVQDGMATIVKYGTKGQVDDVVEIYGEDVAQNVYKSAGKNMEETIIKAKKGDFPDTAFHIQDYDTVMSHLDKYGYNERIFVGDPAYINMDLIESSKTMNRGQLKKIVGDLGLNKEIGDSNEIAILKIKNVKSKFKMDTLNGIPTEKYFDSPLGIPNTGASVGGLPERVINPLFDLDINPEVQIIKVIIK